MLILGVYVGGPSDSKSYFYFFIFWHIILFHVNILIDFLLSKWLVTGHFI